MMTDPLPQPGDILVFFRPHRWLDYFIKLFTRSRYYHVALYAGDHHVVEARPQGVVLSPIGSREGGYTVVQAPYGKGAQALEWAKSQLGAGFDNGDFLVVFLEHVFVQLHINHARRGKYSCTELVAESFKHSGTDLFPGKDTDDIEPKDFVDIKPITAVAVQ